MKYLILICSMVLAQAAIASTDIQCKETTLTLQHGNGQEIKALKCSFVEEWTYAYGADLLVTTEHTAKFARSSIHTKCAKEKMNYARYENPEGTGGISNYKVKTKDLKGMVSVEVSGNFYCADGAIE